MAFAKFFVLTVVVGTTSCASGDARVPETDDRSDATVDGGAAPGVGSWDDPIVITALPFSFDGDTSAAPADLADSYSCAPSTNESGGEYLFRLDLEEPALIRIKVVDQAAGDIDLHLLDSPSASSCITRDDREIVQNLAAGEHWIAADTWVDGTGTIKAGPFQLTVTTDSGATNCSLNPLPNCDEGDAPLVNGVPEEAPGTGGCPDGMISVDNGAFCIDRYEAMLVKVEQGGTHSPWSPYLNPGNETVLAMSVAEVVPQGHISQVQAVGACAEAGKRLCSNTEWLRACQGADTRVYPYGDTHQEDVCNEDRECHPVTQYYETSADWVWSESLSKTHPC